MIQTSTKNDVTRERFVYGAELVGKYQFPLLPRSRADLTGLQPVPFTSAAKEKHPKKSLCHFFTHDCEFEKLWNQPEKYFEMLGNFQYVCAPDFSLFGNMPLALQIWQVYRSRALSWWLSLHGVNIIPVATWAGAESYNFCFDGLPERSVIAVSTNGCFSASGKAAYRDGFREMVHRLQPEFVLVIGRELDPGIDCNIVYMPGQAQQVAERLKR